MSARTIGAEIAGPPGQTMLVRTLWKDNGERGESLRIAHPVSSIERFLFAKDRLSPRTLRRVSVLAYLLIPVLILLNTVVPQIPAIPYLLTLSLTLILFAIALTAGAWFFFGAGLTDRLQDNPLRAMKAPAVPAPLWWTQQLDEVSTEAVTAYQKAYLAREVTEERIGRGRSLQGQFTPAQQSYRIIEVGLEYLTERKRRLTELLAVESLDGKHLQEMLRVAEEPGIPDSIIANASVAEEVRDWVRDN